MELKEKIVYEIIELYCNKTIPDYKKLEMLDEIKYKTEVLINLIKDE